MTSIAPGFRATERSVITHEGRLARVMGVPDLDHVVIEYLDDGSRKLALLKDVGPAEASRSRPNPTHVELATADPKDVEMASERFAAIEPLLALKKRSRADVEKRAKEVACSPSTLYRWINQLQCTGTLSDLLPKQVSEAKGRTKLPKIVEQIIEAVIKFYPQKFKSIKSAFEEIEKRCKNIGERPPHEGTVRNRIIKIAPSEITLRSRGRKAARDDYAPKPDRYSEATAPLSVIQIDHVLLPIQIVDEKLRKAIGRPWLTLAMDVFSRVVWGMLLSLESPRTLSLALCLAHGMLPKDAWLAQRGITGSWPVYGRPRALHCDNAKEFRGDMLLLAAKDFHFNIYWRPVRKPEYGAHIERLCGTLQNSLMEIPGAAPAPSKRNEDVDVEAESCMTLSELEQWIALQVIGRYHQTPHSSLGMTPLEKWQLGLLGDEETPAIGMPERFNDPRAVLLRLLPHTKRTIQQYGIQHMRLNYWDPALIPYINHRDGASKGREFLVRWDPRDLSHIYVWMDELQNYIEVPYRNQARPAVTQRQLEVARAALKSQGITTADEDAIFRVIEEQGKLVDTAVSRTKSARKETARRDEARRTLKETPSRAPARPSLPPPPSTDIDYAALLPFGDDDDA